MQILKNGILPVSHLDVLIEQAMHSAAFDKKVIKIKKAGRSHLQQDRLRSAFRLIQE